MKSKQLIAAVALLGTLSMPVMALSLDEARANGWVGESTNGLLVIRPGANASVKGFVNEINSARLQEFKRGAQKSGVDVNTFQQRMGQRLIQRLNHGEWYQDANGQWKTK